MLEVFKQQFTLANISGIPVRVDLRWLLVLILLTVITAASLEPLVQNLLGSTLLALSAAFLFFASIFLHEYAHALVARMEGLNVVEIILHPFGGLARFQHAPETPRAEFRIAIAGPAASFLLTLVFVGMIGISNQIGTDILTLILFLLALTNFLIAVFNLFPGYPLDGGRVLRAYLWKQGKDLNDATVLTGRCGQMIAVGLIVLGLVFVVARGEFFTGFWAVVVGIFLLDSATSIIREVNSEEHIRVETIMMLPYAIAPETAIQRLIDDVLPLHRRALFPVAEQHRFLGMLVLDDIKELDAGKWRSTSVRQVMRIAESDHFVHTDNSVSDARKLMESNGLHAVAVLTDEGKLVGVVHAGRLRKRL